MTDTVHSTTSSSNEEEVIYCICKNFLLSNRYTKFTLHI